MHPLESSHCEVAGYPTHLLEGGAGSDALVWFPALLDSAAGFGRVMRLLLRRLAGNVRLIAVDPPGYGAAALQPGRGLPSFAEWTAWCAGLAALLERRCPGRMVFAGNSSGGVAATAAAVSSARCAGLALVCWCDWQGVPAPDAGVLCPRDAGAARRLLARSWHCPPQLPESALAALVREAAAPAFVAHVESFDAGAYRSLLRGFSGGLRLIGGDSDGLVPAAELYRTAAAHGDASVHVLARCGHYPHRERPMELAGLLAALIETQLAWSSLPLAAPATKRTALEGQRGTDCNS